MTTLTGMSTPARLDQSIAAVLDMADTHPLAAYELADKIVHRADRALAHVSRVDDDGQPHGHKDSRDLRDDSETLRPVERT